MPEPLYACGQFTAEIGDHIILPDRHGRATTGRVIGLNPAHPGNELEVAFLDVEPFPPGSGRTPRSLAPVRGATLGIDYAADRDVTATIDHAFRAARHCTLLRRCDGSVAVTLPESLHAVGQEEAAS